MIEFEIKLRGLAECEARIVELNALAGERLLRRALRRAAAPLQERAAAHARAIGRGTPKKPGSSGALAASIGIVARPPQRGQVARVSVAPRYRNKTSVFVHNSFHGRDRRAIFYGHFLEFGHRIGTRRGRLRRESRAVTEAGLARYMRRRGLAEGDRRRIRGVEAGGTVPARPWLMPAVRATRSQMTDLFLAEMRAATNRLVRRYNRKRPEPDGLIPP